MWSRVIAKESDLGSWWIGESVLTVPEGYHAGHHHHHQSHPRRRLQEKDVTEDDSDEEDEDSTDANNDGDKGDPILDEDKTFGMQAEGVEQEEVRDIKGGSSLDDEEEDAVSGEDEDETEGTETLAERDYSSYDTWMGVLSATSIKYFVRIVPSSEVGVVSLDET